MLRVLKPAGTLFVTFANSAMLASLRIAYKLGPIGMYLAGALEPADPVLSDAPWLRCLPAI